MTHACSTVFARREHCLALKIDTRVGFPFTSSSSGSIARTWERLKAPFHDECPVHFLRIWRKNLPRIVGVSRIVSAVEGRKPATPGDGFLVEQSNVVVVGRWIDARLATGGWFSRGGGEARTAVRHPHALFLRPLFLLSPSRFSLLFWFSRYSCTRVARFSTSCFAVNRYLVQAEISRAATRHRDLATLFSVHTEAGSCLSAFPYSPANGNGNCAVVGSRENAETVANDSL